MVKKIIKKSVSKVSMAVFAFFAIVIVLGASIVVVSLTTEDGIDSIQPQAIFELIQPASNQEEISTKEADTQSIITSSSKAVTPPTTNPPTPPPTTNPPTPPPTTNPPTPPPATLSEDEIRFNKHIEHSISFNSLVDTTCSISKYQGPNYKSYFESCINEVISSPPDSNQNASEAALFFDVMLHSTGRCGPILAGDSATKQSKFEEALSCIKREHKYKGLEIITGLSSRDKIRFVEHSISFNSLVDTTCSISKYQGPNYKSYFESCMREVIFSPPDTSQGAPGNALFIRIMEHSTGRCGPILAGDSATKQSKFEEALSCIKREYKSKGLELI